MVATFGAVTDGRWGAWTRENEHVLAICGATVLVMAGQGITGPVLSAFESFLRRCDLVKFAKLRPGPEACRRLLAEARSLVDETRPQWEAEPPEAADEAGDVNEAGAENEAGDVNGATGVEDVEEVEVA